jgi:multidrug efflux pump
VNPADSPIIHDRAHFSHVLSKGQMYDAASTIMAQKLSQVQGVGQVGVGGSALPGVRVELNPTALNKYGIGLEQVRTALAAANANTPKGHFSDGKQMWEVGANDQLFKPSTTSRCSSRITTARRCASPTWATWWIRWKTCATPGIANGKPSVLVIIFRQPGANIIETVDRIRAVCRSSNAAIPASIDLTGGHGPDPPSALRSTMWSAPC